MSKSQIAKAKTFEDVPKDVQNIALALYAQYKDQLDLLASKEDLTQVDIQASMSEIGKRSGSEVFVIANPGDLKTCEKCRKWIGKKVSDTDSHYPSIQESGQTVAACISTVVVRFILFKKQKQLLRKQTTTLSESASALKSQQRSKHSIVAIQRIWCSTDLLTTVIINFDGPIRHKN